MPRLVSRLILNDSLLAIGNEDKGSLHCGHDSISKRRMLSNELDQKQLSQMTNRTCLGSDDCKLVGLTSTIVDISVGHFVGFVLTVRVLSLLALLS